MAAHDGKERKWRESLASTEAGEQVAGERQPPRPWPGLLFGPVGSGSFTLLTEAVAQTQAGGQEMGPVVFSADFTGSEGVTFGTGAGRPPRENGKRRRK
jgi:hypothetical protein